jgi:hypothetical protein
MGLPISDILTVGEPWETAISDRLAALGQALACHAVESQEPRRVVSTRRAFAQ